MKKNAMYWMVVFLFNYSLLHAVSSVQPEDGVWNLLNQTSDIAGANKVWSASDTISMSGVYVLDQDLTSVTITADQVIFDLNGYMVDTITLSNVNHVVVRNGFSQDINISSSRKILLEEIQVENPATAADSHAINIVSSEDVRVVNSLAVHTGTSGGGSHGLVIEDSNRVLCDGVTAGSYYGNTTAGSFLVTGTCTAVKITNSLAYGFAASGSNRGGDIYLDAEQTIVKNTELYNARIVMNQSGCIVDGCFGTSNNGLYVFLGRSGTPGVSEGAVINCSFVNGASAAIAVGTATTNSLIANNYFSNCTSSISFNSASAGTLNLPVGNISVNAPHGSNFPASLEVSGTAAIAAAANNFLNAEFP